MKQRGLKFLFLLLTLVLLVGVLPGMGMTAYAAANKTITWDSSNWDGLFSKADTGGSHTDENGISASGDAFWKNGNNENIVFMYNNCAANFSISNGKFSSIEIKYDEKALLEDLSTGWTDNGNSLKWTGESNEVTLSGSGDVRVTSIVFTIETADAYSVTYKHGAGTGTEYTRTVTKVDGVYKHPVEACRFTAPEGKHFDHWYCSDGNNYHYGDTINPVTDDLTLTAIWVADSKPSSSGGGSGGGVDLVFNIPGADDSWEYVGGYAPQQAYRVSLAPMQGGSAALGLTTGDSGTALNVYPTSAVYVFPNADPGYTLDKIVWSLIDGSASYDITEAKNFVMPAMDVVVYVTFRPLG